MESDQFLNGTNGRLWFDNDLLDNTISFESKQVAKYEEQTVNGKLGTIQVFIGYSIEGSMKSHKTDHVLAKRISQSFSSGKPLIAKLNAEMADGRISLTGIKFKETGLVNFENAKLGEEQFDFTAEEVIWL